MINPAPSSQISRNLISPKIGGLWHGGDYNPEQWPEEVWLQDAEWMDLANVNVVTVGVFSWATYEPSEHQYDFAWLDRIFDIQRSRGAYVVLATPSAAMPAWMAQKYPEILRAGPDGKRRQFGDRVNYCLSSKVYREKVSEIDRILSKRYGDRDNLVLWHISNEFSGACYCDSCRAEFQNWLQSRYMNSLDQLNCAYNNRFWSHTYSSWDQIGIPEGDYGDTSTFGLLLDWRRFVTDITVDFMNSEIDAVRKYSSNIPITTNLMGTYEGIDYAKMAEDIDVVSWDSYPFFCDAKPGIDEWVANAFRHDLMRSLKPGNPFLLIESAPSNSNWYEVMQLKRPGVHRLEELQAIAHGSDSAMYFQWRQSKGSAEMYHGAVVTHSGGPGTRTFDEVADLGKELLEISQVAGSKTCSDLAIYYNWEVCWSLDLSKMPLRDGLGYLSTALSFYKHLWERGCNVDVICRLDDLKSYKAVLLPMAFMLSEQDSQALRKYVAEGGILASTYLTGYVDEHLLAHAGGAPGPLADVLGVSAEEIDGLFPGESVSLEWCEDDCALMQCKAHEICELIRCDTADALAYYASEFYAGKPAATVNAYGKGKAFHLAARADKKCFDAFMQAVMAAASISTSICPSRSDGLSVRTRFNEKHEFVFLLNFADKPVDVDLKKDGCKILRSGQPVNGQISLGRYGAEVLVREL